MIVIAGRAAVHAQVARIEFYAVETYTLTDQELLNGRTGKPATIAGELRLPKSGKDKLPAVVILHGSSGPGGSDGATANWSRQLNALGIATFGLECFAGRGIVSPSTDQGKFGRLNMILDADCALPCLRSPGQKGWCQYPPPGI
jgi:cephalosporin-C deacetylase-like acetyl esterase